jgi:hypothetical protein
MIGIQTVSTAPSAFEFRCNRPVCCDPLICHIDAMDAWTPEPETLRHRLLTEIDRALLTSDEVGETLVACYLQMARDLLDMASPATDPRAVDAGPWTDLPG